MDITSISVVLFGSAFGLIIRIFIQNRLPYEIEFIIILICFAISTSTSAVVWAAIGHSFRKYLNDQKKIIYFNRTMALLLLCSIFVIIIWITVILN